MSNDKASSSDSSEANEDDNVTSEKFLLLVDQLSANRTRHLSIKDIGMILERLSSRILDVERLDREHKSEGCYHWTIKATIRGESLREIGVIYDENYYGVSEHPGYKDGNAEEEESEEID